MERYTLSKHQRLVKNRQFKAVLARRRRRSDGLLVLYTGENQCGYPRFGISVGRSAGSAVHRNRLKRLLREACRLSQHEIPHNIDYLLMIAPGWPKKINKVRAAGHGVDRIGIEEIRRSLLTLVQAGRHPREC